MEMQHVTPKSGTHHISTQSSKLNPELFHRSFNQSTPQSTDMASTLSSSFLSLSTKLKPQHNQLFFFTNRIHSSTISHKPISFKIQAAKLPAGVELPKEQPKLERPFLGFTRTAEIWNSRACMIGLIGTFIVELILNRGILQVIGVDVGKGLDLPL
nr:light-harvesting complex-like protein OHP1, chloroplastic [Ipomoea trifida]